MKDIEWKEFKPTIFFLARFLGVYLVGNIVYGLYITSQYPHPDFATEFVSEQVSWLLSINGWQTKAVNSVLKPTTLLVYLDHSVLAVYEGCNGINTAIIFLAFIAAMGPYTRAMFWFVPVGLLIIHITNLLRILLLFFVAEYKPHWMYFAHKYLFTAIIYLVIFLLWIWWVRKFALKK